MKERKIRIFLSSTFRDMNAERDHIVNKIFPRIAAFCKEQTIEFIPLDLRWGITEEEQKNGRVITTCLEEVDNSRPFFIGLLGERYGWVPSTEELRNIPSNLLSNFKWVEEDIVEGMSITEMEMQYAALRNNGVKHAAFYMRGSKIGSSNPDFKEKTGSIEEGKLLALKNKIENQSRYPYMVYDSIEELGERIYNDVISMIVEEFPELPEDRALDHVHKFIMQQRASSYIEDCESTKAIDKWFAGDERSLLVTGAPGTGKSSLVCNWLQNISQQQPTLKIIYHDYSVNDSDDSEPIYEMAEHINEELRYQFMWNYSNWNNVVGCIGLIPKVLMWTASLMYSPNSRSKNIDRVEAGFNRAMPGLKESKVLLKRLKRLKNMSACIVIDNIDSSEADFEETLKYVKRFPPNVKVIFTASTNSKAAESLKESLDCAVIEEPKFTREMSLEFAQKYLERYSKRFSDKQYELLKECKFIDNPSLVRIILSRLVTFGSFEKLDIKLEEYVSIGSGDDLLRKSLKETIEEFDDLYELNPLELVLVAISASKFGLTEDEIQKVCRFKPIEWSIVRGHIVSMCNYTQHRFVIQSKLFRDIVIELASPSVKDFVLDNMMNYFTSLINCQERSNGSYTADAPEAVDYDLLMAESAATKRQVEVLPNLYLLSYRYKELFNFISYVLNDKYLRSDDRKEYWKLLKDNGYTAKDIKALSGDNMKPTYTEIGKFYDNYFRMAVDEGDIEDMEIIIRKDGAEFALGAYSLRTLLVHYSKKNTKLFFLAYECSFFDENVIQCLANHYVVLMNLRLGKRKEAVESALKNIEYAEQNNLPMGVLSFVGMQFANLCLKDNETAHFKRAQDLLIKVYDSQVAQGLDKKLTCQVLESLGRLLIINKSYKEAELVMAKARKSADILFKKEGYRSYLPYFHYARIQHLLTNYKGSVENFNICIDKMKEFNFSGYYDYTNSYLYIGYAYYYLHNNEEAFKIVSIVEDIIKNNPETHDSLKNSLKFLKDRLNGVPLK